MQNIFDSISENFTPLFAATNRAQDDKRAVVVEKDVIGFQCSYVDSDMNVLDAIGEFECDTPYEAFNKYVTEWLPYYSDSFKRGSSVDYSYTDDEPYKGFIVRHYENKREDFAIMGEYRISHDPFTGDWNISQNHNVIANYKAENIYSAIDKAAEYIYHAESK